jgi:histidinol-phosphatase (PHP family)
LFKHNFHTHSAYSDGKAEPEAYVKAAIAKGMYSLGFSEHAPLPFENNFSVNDADQLKKYVQEIKGLKEKYKGEINIFVALEADYIPNVSLDFRLLKNEFSLDYIIGSVHLVKKSDDRMWFIDGPDREVWKKGLENLFDNDIRAAVTAYYEQIIEMIQTQKAEVIGHIDKIMMHNKSEFLNEEEPWYRELVIQCLEVAAKHDSIIEVNTRGLYKKRYHTFFPDRWILMQMHKMNIPITLSSDAHAPEDVNTLLDEAEATVRQVGYKEVWIMREDGWNAELLD